MLFNSIEFLLFMPLFFVAYWALGRHLRCQNILLLLASYLFYGWWDYRFLALILLTTFSTWICALAPKSGLRAATAFNILLNIGILCCFKYADFFALNLCRLMSAFGWQLDWVTLDILLPVGISFYTFQAIGYSIDVCRGVKAPERDFVNFATFIAYFPQLVAGPIERSTRLLPQIVHPRVWRYDSAVTGMREILWGLFKKVVVADPCGVIVDNCFDTLRHDSIIGWTAAALLFSIQIYFDFSGYSNIARGVSRLLGIELMVNFHNPYFAKNVADFWRRWHISLMHWFREYVYFPLGGSRRGLARTCLNVAIVFVLSGLWHGAAWNFVLWGLYWAAVNVAYRLLGSSRKENTPFLTLLLVILGWVIFRSSDFTTGVRAFTCAIPGVVAVVAILWLVAKPLARIPPRLIFCILCILCGCAFFGCMADATLIPPALKALPALCAAATLYAEWVNRHCNFGLERMPSTPLLRVGIYWTLLYLILTANSVGAQFIYFQF